MDLILISGTKSFKVEEMVDLLLDNEILEETDIMKYHDSMLIFVKYWFDNEKVYQLLEMLKLSTDESIELVLEKQTFRVLSIKHYDNRIDLEFENVAMEWNETEIEYEWLSKYERNELNYDMDMMTKSMNELTI